MNQLTYKGYTAEVEYDANEGILYGRVLDLRDVITFQSESATDIVREFRTSVDEYLAFCAEQGIEPAKPYSGRLPFRTTPENHRKIALAAARAGKSINAWMEEKLMQAIESTTTNPLLAPNLPTMLRVFQTAPPGESSKGLIDIDRVIGTKVSSSDIQQ